MTDTPISLYVHIPFCRTLCTYCAFNTYAGLDDMIPAYVAALCQEMQLAGEQTPGYSAHTLYFGGGTPSLLAARQVARIAAAGEAFTLSADAEITLEVNPGQVTLETLRGYRAAGVNRLSIGVQSAQPADLRLFGRRHTFADAQATYRRARMAGFADISIDLIYGAMGQTMTGWLDTLDRVLAWEPTHFSLYSLILEPGTSLHKRVERGTLPTPDDELAADMYEATQARLAQAGYVHYEISSWGLPDHESVHNRQYWLNQPFVGIGAGAHGAVPQADGRLVRYENVGSVSAYIDQVTNGDVHPFAISPAMSSYEVIDAALEMSETAILNLRLVQEGIKRSAFEARFGQTIDATFGPALDTLRTLGLIVDDGERIRLTARGYLLSNQVFMRLLPETYDQ